MVSYFSSSITDISIQESNTYNCSPPRQVQVVLGSGFL